MVENFAWSTSTRNSPSAAANTTTNWDTPHPIAQPTTLDAQGQGRGIFVASDSYTSVTGDGYISVTIEGLHITGGQSDFGGGIMIIGATATIMNNVISGNTATAGDGGGLCMGPGLLIGNTFFSNTAALHGGGADVGEATLIGNTPTLPVGMVAEEYC